MSKGFASTYRIVLLAAGILACYAALAARLVYLHVIDREELVRYIDQARRQIIVESARRGDILDARGGRRAAARADQNPPHQVPSGRPGARRSGGRAGGAPGGLGDQFHR
ncbi:MAG: hypothetical protein NT173_00340 [Opitutales bacterium]|nr:hypothetical protein [Opitutales bacterium]